jgi:hypothetical protein
MEILPQTVLDALTELDLWRDEAKIAQGEGAHPHAAETARLMQKRVAERLAALHPDDCPF